MNKKSTHQLGSVGKIKNGTFFLATEPTQRLHNVSVSVFAKVFGWKKDVGAFMSCRPRSTPCPTYIGLYRLGLWSFVTCALCYVLPTKSTGLTWSYTPLSNPSTWRRWSTTIWPQTYKFLQLFQGNSFGNWVIGFLVLGAVEGAEGVAVSFSVGGAILARLTFIASGGERLHQMLASESQ